MKVSERISSKELVQDAKKLYQEERGKKRLDGWFRLKEMMAEKEIKYRTLPESVKKAMLIRGAISKIPLTISKYSIFAGTQNDAFARSYALINPNFKVASFSGYCDPSAVFNDIEPNTEFTKERIEALRKIEQETTYVKELNKIYQEAEPYTSEVAFFFEQVTGHVIPDFKVALEVGLEKLILDLEAKEQTTKDEKKKNNFKAMQISLGNVLILADRYADLANQMQKDAEDNRKDQLISMEKSLRNAPRYGAKSLDEAIQFFILLWQMMCLEQAPNPFAFSIGNADRIFEPYRKMSNLSRDEAASLFCHLLVFFNVADRSWAISQNVIISGKDTKGNDLTNEMSYAILDAYYMMNLPQPILSVKLHDQTPDKLYREMGRFLFTPGCLTPSFFNDEAVFITLEKAGIDKKDLPDYSVAGCQEPLIMGKDNGNTTNSWLNLGKILELTLQDGISQISGNRIHPATGDTPETILKNIRQRFYQNVEVFAERMADYANQASQALSLLPVPFLSTFMGGMDSGIDMRDSQEQGTKYNASGCLIHGLSVIADSFIAIDHLLKDRPEDSKRLLESLKTDWEQDGELRDYVLSCPKYGNNIKEVDKEAVEVAQKVSDIIHNQKNYLDNNFRADWSTPSTHLLYGYWVGATPDGRKSREMLGYGIDPLYGEATQGLGFRMLSSMQLPYDQFDGGYASHFGIDPKFFKADNMEERGMQFYQRVIKPLFFNNLNKNVAPFYLYVNVTTPETLKKLLENPKEYAPNGVYIVRIHGTFVNFLDLSPEIQQDIIMRLDLDSTSLA